MISGDRFEWDPAKSASNESKHGISFAAALALWDGFTASISSSRFGEEERHLAVGLIDGKLWTAVYTLQGDRFRLISVRRSRSDEKALYQNHCP